MRILLADDEPDMCRGLKTILEKNGCTTDAVENGLAALELGLSRSYDALVLDIMMPGLDGLGVVRQLRVHRIQTPVIMLTAKSERADCISGLDAGADEYLTKPFHTGELLARLRALVRRGQTTGSEPQAIGNVTINRVDSQLVRGDSAYNLSQKELRLLELLAASPNCQIGVDQILERVWNLEAGKGDQTVRIYMAYLNTKLTALEADSEIRMIGPGIYSLVLDR